ncbi:hypothetical protein DB41_JE00040 [Neochlamydia sp. TUME1]|uniref:F-box/LRR-repeat protein n=1 Tax=Neochlamydia sp. TUME1 TaxID=1478174 RepID=UPI0005829ECF|nr:leucine-rich repeat domain-containing protein [Neochlamydia sp. TUME1]KIC73603.1 hypothetical protein DB41_JE00040 [Neochlamydia sp. TUME1]
MHTHNSITLEHLPNEMLTSILKYCTTPSLSSVCRKWRHLLASEVMPSLYKQIVKVHFPQGNVNKHAFILDKIYELDHELLPLQKVKAIFKQAFTLAKSLFSLEFKDTSQEYIYLTSANYTTYLLNINRLLIWKKLLSGEKYLEQEEIKHLSLAGKGKLFKDWIERYGRAITSLQLEGIGLTFLPPEMWQLSQLEELFLNNNNLTILPDELGQLRGLKMLRLDHNQLTTLPARICQLSELVVLDLGHNQLTALPVQIEQLSQLQVFLLSHNQLTAIPAQIEQLSQLQVFLLSHNQLTAIPAEIGQLSNLQKLWLSNNQLTAIPAEIGDLSQLQTLDLNNNQIIAVPTAIGRLFELEGLWLSNNQLTAIPAEIGQLSNLQKLWLSNNQLTTIPTEIGRLSHLKILDLAHNQIATFPIEEIEELPHLEILLRTQPIYPFSAEIMRSGPL